MSGTTMTTRDSNLDISPSVSGWFPQVEEAPSKKDQRFLDMASGVALTSKCKFRHGAVVVHHGTVLGSSCNIRKNDPYYVDHKFSSIHAEVRALRRAGFPKKATIYVARVNRFGETRNSKPCEGCQSLLDELNVKVVHT